MPLLRRVFFLFTAAVAAILVLESQAFAGEAELVLPKLDQAIFFGNIDGRSLLMLGLIVAVLGLVPAEALREANIYTSFNFNYTALVVTAVFFVLLTIPLARLTDYLGHRAIARQHAGGVT